VERVEFLLDNLPFFLSKLKKMSKGGRPRNCPPEVKMLWQKIRYDELDAAKTILEKYGIDAEDSEAKTALINAVSENKADFVTFLIENGAKINHQDRTGYSALHFAASGNHLKLAEFLIKNGANPNLQDENGNTPLWIAVFEARKNGLDFVQFLLKSGANCDILNQYQKSARMMFQLFFGYDNLEIGKI
jgi:uncharacterized protein